MHLSTLDTKYIFSSSCAPTEARTSTNKTIRQIICIRNGCHTIIYHRHTSAPALLCENTIKIVWNVPRLKSITVENGKQFCTQSYYVWIWMSECRMCLACVAQIAFGPATPSHTHTHTTPHVRAEIFIRIVCVCVRGQTKRVCRRRLLTIIKEIRSIFFSFKCLGYWKNFCAGYI